MLRALSGFVRLPLAEKIAVLEALILLVVFRLVVAIVPFRRIARRFAGVRPGDGAEDGTAGDEPRARRVGSLLRATARRLPWTSTCLVQALAGHAMLSRRNIPSTMVLGVRPGEAAPLDAHAWLRSGKAIVTGGAGHADFHALAAFE